MVLAVVAHDKGTAVEIGAMGEPDGWSVSRYGDVNSLFGGIYDGDVLEDIGLMELGKGVK